MTPEQEYAFRLWEVAGTWLSSLGTIAAVLVAVILSRRDRAIELEIEADHRIQIGGDRPQEEFAYIRAVNASDRLVTVVAVGWKAGFFKKVHLYQLTNTPGSTPLPAKLITSEAATFLLPLDLHGWRRSTVDKLRDGLGPKFPRLKLWSMKVIISPSVGRSKTRRIAPSLRKVLLETWNASPDTDGRT